MSSPQLKAGNNAGSLFICVGDVSADIHASRVVSQLKRSAPQLEIWGVGGDQMQNQGVKLLHHLKDLSCFGIVEVLKYLPRLSKVKKELLQEIAHHKPAAVLLVDFGGFNLSLAKALRKKHPQLPIIYFISPQVWASRPWRLKTIARTVSKMLVIFPFEETVYQKRGISSVFVGHPLTLSLPLNSHNREQFCSTHNLSADRPIVGIFPGSRKQEIVDLLPVIITAANWLHKERPEVQLVISRANQAMADELEAQLRKLKAASLLRQNVTLLPVGESHALMQAADILWAKSGTTTLEAALFGKPMLIFYRGNWLSYLLFLLFKRVHKVGWPNLLAGKEVVPELLQLDCRAEQFVRYTCDWLDVPSVQAEIGQELKSVRQRLGDGDFAQNAAQEILQTLKTEISVEVKEPC